MSFQIEQLRSARGSIIFGRLHANVFYARLDGSISTDLGVRFTRQILTMIGDTVAVRYFVDASTVDRYDVGAFAAAVDALLVTREQFQLILARPWAGRVGATAASFARGLGCIEFVSATDEFDLRLRESAPHAVTRLQRLLAPALPSAMTARRDSVRAPGPRS